MTELDCIGLLCPLPVLKSRRALRGLAPGVHLLVRTTDPMAAIDIPHMCTTDG
ncbi:sulfurtransferase TusA family protein, partial [Mycobacterium tuberculosis]|nr:sulfurtransferase TusA family protein [Mycobacterium tuberculosis]